MYLVKMPFILYSFSWDFYWISQKTFEFSVSFDIVFGS